MRSVIDLLDLPYAYWQLPLLTEDQFRREAKARGVHFFDRQLEGFQSRREDHIAPGDVLTYGIP